MIYPPRVILQYQTENKTYLPEPVISPPSSIPQLWRYKHDPQPFTRLNLPEVNPMFPNHFVEFGEAWQRLERELNYKLADRKWRALHTYQRAFNNYNGFEKPGDPRADFINKMDVTAAKPKQEALLCGGAIFPGYTEGALLVIETLNSEGPVPTLTDLKQWQYLDAVSIDEDIYHNGIIRRFPQGGGERVFILLLANRNRYPKIYVPLANVEKLDMTKPLPDPYRYP
jgi:hypothetical protein